MNQPSEAATTAPSASAATTVPTSPQETWRAVVELATQGRPDGEMFSGHWVRPIHPAGGPVVGAKFRGWNRNGVRRWRTTSTVTVCEPGRAFGFRVTSLGLAVADWRYDLTATGSGATTVTESTRDQRGLLLKILAPVVTGAWKRADRNQRGIHATLAHLQASTQRRSPRP